MKLYKLPLGICLACLCFMQIGCGPKDLETFRDCDECPEMVRIPAGSFLMGGSPFSNSSNESPQPQHKVKIQTYAIGKYEVTQEQWFAVTGENNSQNKGRTLPVENISWDDAQLFVKKLSQKTGKKYRLPSEAEWEYAARAGTTTNFFWGDDPKLANEYAWSINNSETSHAVGLKKPNQFGLYDTSGNISEWVQDQWNPDYRGAPSDGRAWAEGLTDDIRIFRGGSRGNFIPENAYRDWGTRNTKNTFIGIRVARDLP